MDVLSPVISVLAWVISVCAVERAELSLVCLVSRAVTFCSRLVNLVCREVIVPSIVVSLVYKVLMD